MFRNYLGHLYSTVQKMYLGHLYSTVQKLYLGHLYSTVQKLYLGHALQLVHAVPRITRCIQCATQNRVSHTNAIQTVARKSNEPTQTGSHGGVLFNCATYRNGELHSTLF